MIFFVRVKKNKRDHIFVSFACILYQLLFLSVTLAFASHWYSDNSSMVGQGASGGGEGFEVSKYGHGRVALIGFPRLVMH